MVVSGSDGHTTFATKSLNVEPWLAAWEIIVVLSGKVEVKNSNDEAICRMYWTGYYGF